MLYNKFEYSVMEYVSLKSFDNILANLIFSYNSNLQKDEFRHKLKERMYKMSSEKITKVYQYYVDKLSFILIFRKHSSITLCHQNKYFCFFYALFLLKHTTSY